MKKITFLILGFCYLFAFRAGAQSAQDSLDIIQAALDYIESQHDMKPQQFERAAHPPMVKTYLLERQECW